jgi:predicted hydrocarbon binding protein
MSDNGMKLTDNGMVAITRDSFAALRGALMRDTGYAAFGYLQEAGYAGGAQLFEAFGGWLSAHGAAAPDALSLDEFQQLATDFFRECGWGSLAVGDLHEAVATLDSSDWAEAAPDAGMEHPCCHFTSGMFSDFFGRVANAPLAVMEVECRSVGAARCRFLLGSTEVLQHVYDAMAAGSSYDSAVAAV